MNTSISDLVRRYFEEVWGQGDLGAQRALIAPHYQGYWLIAGMPVRQGPEAHEGWLKSIRAGLPDLHYQIADPLVDGTRAAVRVTLTGTHQGPLAGRPATGRKVTVDQTFFFHIDQGQILREWVAFDRAGFLDQLANPSDS